MRTLSILLIASALALVMPFSASAAVGVPFGGLVTAQYVCNTGMLIYVKTSVAVVPYMWFWGNLPFASHIPPHPGQWLVGMASPTPAPCVLGYVPIGAGLPIIFHGSSI